MILLEKFDDKQLIIIALFQIFFAPFRVDKCTMTGIKATKKINEIRMLKIQSKTKMMINDLKIHRCKSSNRSLIDKLRLFRHTFQYLNTLTFEN